MNEVTKSNYEKWLNSPVVSSNDKEKLKKMSEEEIDDSFFKEIAFGTAGIRGILGPGTNRMNLFTVNRATVGFGLYLKSKFKGDIYVAISHDNRYMSREFTLASAEILNKMGINAYIFDSLRSTPELSFTVRYKKCQGGIMITASHNPKEHNGYKVYDECGCQLVPSKIKDLIDIIKNLGDPLEVKIPESEVKGKTIMVGEDVDAPYCKLVESIEIDKTLDKKGFKIVFSPNHGTSYVNAMRVFKDLGYEVIPVEGLCDPDPAFTGLLSPNPEDPRAFIKPIEVAKKENAELIVMTDPDGDRVGLASLGKDHEYHLMTGNESAALLLDYILMHKVQDKEDLSKYVVYNTVVSSMIGKAVCDYYNVRIESFLTGFKYIGNQIEHYKHEENGYNFLFGYEESYGCLISDEVRDKDGTQAILLYSEMALYYHKLGMDLVEAYDALCKKLGKYYKSSLFNIYFEGSEGQAKMQSIMNELETKPFKEILGNKVSVVENYFKLSRKNLLTNEESKIENIPIGDLVKFFFEDGSNVSIRPSGTEPKCKFYIEVTSKEINEKESLKKCEAYFEEIKKVLNIK